MATLYREKDIDSTVLGGKTVAVVGYGTQGQSHAKNLRDSGISVIVGERAGSPNARLAEEHGFTACSVADAAEKADVIALLAPDQAKLFENDILPRLTENKALLFATGFAVHFGQIVPPDTVDVVLVAPKSPGGAVRTEFEKGGGVPCLVAVHRDFSGNAMKIALAYGLALGGARAGLVESTFREETEAALFSSQAVLMGGVPELVRAAFDTLAESGIQPEIAWCNILYELKHFVDIAHRDGLAGLLAGVSDMTGYGGLTRGPRVVGEAGREAMREVLGEIRNGAFAREWLCESMVNLPVLRRLRDHARTHPVETAGGALRSALRDAAPDGDA